MTFGQWTGVHFRGCSGRRCCLRCWGGYGTLRSAIFATAMFSGTVTVTELGAVCMAIAGVGGAVAGAIASGDCALAEEQKQD